MRITTSYRPKSIFVSDEVYTYLSAMAKALVNGTDAAITVDAFTDSYLREKITRENPELVGLHEELEAKKQEARKGYHSIEERMMDAVGVAKVVEAKCRRCDGRGWYSVEKPNCRTGDAEPQQEQCAACYGTGKVVEAKESLGG